MSESKLSIINKILSIGAIKCNLNDDQNVQKSDAEAERIRLEGNLYFKAIELYTKSLSFARSDELKGKAFGNRSACFFELNMRDHCLKDIELAEKQGYITQKLRSRRLEAIGRPQVPLTENNFFDQKPDKQLPDTLRCKYDPHFGRGLYAARDIMKGETILVEDDFVFATTTDSRYQKCEFCWKHKVNFIPCPQCTDTVFCDSKCMEAAQWYHKHECGINNEYSRPVSRFNAITVQALRSVFYGVQCFGNVNQLWNFFLNIVLNGDVTGCSLIPHNLSDPRTKYGFFLTLVPLKPRTINDYGQYEHESDLEELSSEFYTKKSWLDKFSDEEQWKLHHMFLYNIHILYENSYFILEGKLIAYCYLMASLFNHNCVRNAKTFHRNRRIIVLATKNIQNGEQIYRNYMESDTIIILPTSVTHKYLKELAGVDCQCGL